MHTMCVLASILLHIFRCESNIMNEWMGKCCERDAFLRVFVTQQQTVKCTRKRDNPLARTYISWWYISCTTHARDYYFDLCACLYVFHKLTGSAARKRPDSEFRIANSNFNWYCNTQFFIWCAFSHRATLYSLFYLSGFDYCGALAIIASLECSISIHFTECIGTLLTKLIRTYVQLILFLRVANQLHIAFDKQMKESPINWHVTRNKRIKSTTNSKQILALCHVIWAIAFVFL